MNKKHRNLILLIVLCSVVVLSSTMTYAFAKYYGQMENSYPTISDTFYFKSNILESENDIKLYGGGTHTINIDVNNFLDNLRINESDINYSVSATATNSYTGFSITNSSVVTSGGTLLSGSKRTDNLVLTISSGYVDRTEIYFVLESTSPYEKTITKTIYLRTTPPSSYSINDSVGSNYFTLNILINDNISVDTPLIINWTAGELFVDTTNNYVINSTKTTDINNNIYQINLGAVEEFTSITLIYIKDNINNNYTLASTALNITNTITIESEI